MKSFRALITARDGAAALEFALVAPIFFLVVVAIFQLGMAFHASAGLRNGVEAAARHAQIYPRPTNSQLQTMFANNLYGLPKAQVGAATLTYGATNGTDYVDVSARYDYKLNFLFMPGGTIALSHTRRAYQY